MACSATLLGADFHAELEVIAALMDLAATRGWPRFFSTVWYERDDEASVFRSKLPALDRLRAGSEAVQIDARLELAPDDQVFRKTHASCFFATDLDRRLQASGIESLLIAGFTTSGCVRATAVDALQHDYRSVVVADAVGDHDAAAHRANLYDMGAKYADVQDFAAIAARY